MRRSPLRRSITQHPGTATRERQELGLRGRATHQSGPAHPTNRHKPFGLGCQYAVPAMRVSVPARAGLHATSQPIGCPTQRIVPPPIALCQVLSSDMEERSGGRAVVRVVDARLDALDWPDSELVERAGVHKNTLTNWRAGKGTSLDTMSRVATALEMPLSALCDAHQGRVTPEMADMAAEPLQAVLDRQARAIEDLTDQVAAVVAGQDDLATFLRAELAADDRAR